jgi:hypothetical protein
LRAEGYLKGRAVIYAAFSVYLLGVIFAGQGVYRLWADMIKPRRVSWALLPGTVVAEMAYIFGCLITGGEIRRAKLMSGGGGAAAPRRKASGGEEAEPTTEAAPRFRFIGPMVASFMCTVACGAGIIVARSLLGDPVIDEFAGGSRALLPYALPGSTEAFWSQLRGHLDLLRRMSATWLELDWLDWRVPLFVYVSVCLSIRLAPVRRSLRATLAAVVVLAGGIALVGVIWSRFDGLMRNDLWPLVTYTWSLLLFLLAVSLIVRGGVALVRALIEDDRHAPAGKGD